MSETPHCPDCGSPMSEAGWSQDLCPECLLRLALDEESSGAGAEHGTAAATPALETGPPPLSRGKILGNRYGLRKFLGRGGMGEVWHAFDLKLRVDVALKTVRPELITEPRVLETLRQEVRTAREVVSPNVCRVHDLQELGGRELVSMEYVDGNTLRAVLEDRSPIDLQEAREMAAQFLAGLDAIHQAGLVHRDIKPENLMITRTGRVVVMDFGIAKGLAPGGTGTVAGTPAYMAPEQARGEGVDTRADVFSAGVVLAEMLAPEGVRDRAAREALWRGVRQQPPQLPESPWLEVIGVAVAHRPEQRFAAASALARALEEVTIRVEGAEDARPYPGLMAFNEQTREYFFGRELEAEALWKKIRRLHLLAVIGPSGAGKTSFLRAGLLGNEPAGWAHVICTPGEAPLTALRQALVPELSGDSDAIRELVKGEDPEAMVSAVSRWRSRSRHALLVVDQFEELFTLNPPEVQAAFAALLGRLAVDADLNVLLSLRDDFLIRCNAHEGLSPILSELTLLGPPTGAALRRAIVQPALKCGYRFEDEALVDQMLSEVEGERGVLPLVAFAAEQLWERRDKKQGVLTREAHEVIGGVGGALAQHAELTLEKVGTARAAVVRELFRNLVTGEGTRAVRDRDELLSVFPQGKERDAAAEILDALIDARLLTSYGAEAVEGTEQVQQRVEIVHESLLTAWPRLVRWQAQDVEGAKMRDDLRQAARRWQERDRRDDLLWSGSVYREFQVWRERYPGSLSEIEDAFAEAMAAHEERTRRRRRLVVGIAFAAMLGVIGVVTALWQQAAAQARRAEASNLVTLGRAELDQYPTAALAHARTSLELADTPAARRLVLEALWKGPTVRILPIGGRNSRNAAFGPDGRWLATSPFDNDVLLFPDDGGPPRVLDEGRDSGHSFPEFTPDGSTLLTGYGEDFHMISVEDGREVRGLPQLKGWFSWAARAEGLLTFVRDADVPSLETVDLCPWDGKPSRVLGSFHEEWLSVDQELSRVALRRGDRVLVRSLGEGAATEREVTRIENPSGVVSLQFTPRGDALLVAEPQGGRLTLWPLDILATRKPRVFQMQNADFSFTPRFNRDGSRLAWGSSSEAAVSLWDLDGPPAATPVVLKQSGAAQTKHGTFHPGGGWLVVPNELHLSFWALDQPRAHVLRGHESQVWHVSFTPDSNRLVSCEQAGPVRVWPLDPGAGDALTIEIDVDQCQGLALGPDAEKVLLGEPGGARVVPLSGGDHRVLPGARTWAVAFDPSGRRAAAAKGFGGPRKMIRIWDLESEDPPLELSQVPPGEQAQGSEWAVFGLAFTPDGDLIAAGQPGIRRFNPETGDSEWIWRLDPEWTANMALSRDGNVLLAAAWPSDPGIAAGHSVVLFDLARGTRRPILSHGSRVVAVALDPSGSVLVTGDMEGVIRVGPADGGEPHLLLGHDGGVNRPNGPLAVSPDSRWIASGAGSEIRVWPMPDVAQTPLHVLRLDELLDKVHELTNVQVVKDDASATGYEIEIGPFPGWEDVPTW